MIYEHTEGGIVIPKSLPPSPKPVFPPLEIQDEDRRVEAAWALYALWDALELSKGRRMLERSAFDAHYAAFRYIGEMILGRDCPEREMPC